MIGTLLDYLLISLVINIVMFLVAYRFKSDKLTDVSYAVTFAVLAILAFEHSSAKLSSVLLLVMIVLWAGRIGGFLLYRVIKSGRDRRFDGIREDFVKFGRFWIGQAVTVWVLMLPSILAFTHSKAISPLSVVGIVIWGSGLLIESIADFQKYAFNKDLKNKDKWIDSGIWHYSRHPNYFGEILIWIGIYLYTLSSLSLTEALVGVVSPVFIIILLLFISGIPILEKAADKKWGTVKAYRDYKASTSILVPLPK